MRIVFSKGGFIGPVSGSDEAMVNYSEHLRRAGHEPRVLLTNAFSSSDSYYLRLQAMDVPVRSIVREPLYQKLRIWKRLGMIRHRNEEMAPLGEWQELAYRTALRYFQRTRPDVLHVLVPEISNAVLICAAAEVSIPIIYHELGTPYYSPEAQEGYEAIARVLSKCRAVAALTPTLAERCRQSFGYDGLTLVIPFIAVDPYEGEWIPRAPSNKVVFGYAARLENWKGPQVLIESFARIASEYPQARLKIAGAGPDKEALIAQVERLGISKQCEFVAPYAGPEAKYTFMRGLDVFVQPSFAEGLPNSVMEAMTCGLPIIASAVGGVPDMLTTESGLLVPAGDVEALALALGRLAGDAELRERMGGAARQRYEELFTSAAVMPVLLAAYERVCQPSQVIPVDHPWVGAAKTAL